MIDSAEIRRVWTPEEEVRLRDLYPDHPSHEVARALGRSRCAVFQRARLLGLGKSEAFWQSDLSGRVQRGQQNPAMKATRFPKGKAPWNKGMKGSCGTHPNCRPTQFKKGALSGRAKAQVKPLGAERIADGVLQRKVNNGLPFQRRWRSVHSLVWEAAHGPIPKGHKVIFRPGQHTTVAELITPDRLELVSNAELMSRNSYHTRYPKEVGHLIQMRGQLNRKINRLTQEKSDEEQD